MDRRIEMTVRWRSSEFGWTMAREGGTLELMGLMGLAEEFVGVPLVP